MCRRPKNSRKVCANNSRRFPEPCGRGCCIDKACRVGWAHAKAGACEPMLGFTAFTPTNAPVEVGLTRLYRGTRTTFPGWLGRRDDSRLPGARPLGHRSLTFAMFASPSMAPQSNGAFLRTRQF